MELVNYQSTTNKSGSEESPSRVEYIMTEDEEDKTVRTALTLVDVHNKLPSIQESNIPEEFSQDSDEEKEYEHHAQITKQYAGIV
jgi:hypothetical protein